MLVAAAWGAALELALCALLALADQAPGEPLLVRWLRGLADHPLRSGTAIGFALWAILPSPVPAPPATASDAVRTDGGAGPR